MAGCMKKFSENTSHFFSILDIWSRFRDIRDQSRKLSKIALNFGRFFAVPNFRGQAFQKLYPRYHHWLATRRLEKNCEDTPAGPEVMDVHTLNFKPNIKFSRLISLGGPPSPLGCALARLGQSVKRVKI